MPALFLLLAVVLYRVVSALHVFGSTAGLQNFAPLAAVVLCGALYLPRRAAVILPLAMLLVSDVIINTAAYHEPLLSWQIVPRYLAFGLIAAGGWALRGKVNAPGVLGASVVGSLVFYAVTNTGSWLGEPLYARTFAGWIQALTTGLPGYLPTWWFYRQTLLSDVAFTGLFLVCLKLGAPKLAAPKRALSVESAR